MEHAMTDNSNKAEPFRIADCRAQLGLKLVARAVLWQQRVIEATAHAERRKTGQGG
jgi:hypothetical protein